MSDTERNPLPKMLPKALRDAWVGALGVAEAEAGKATARLLDAVGVHHDAESPPKLRAAVHELASRVKHNRDELERRLDEGVRAALQRVHRPIADEIAVLRTRIEAVQKRIDELKAREPRGPAPRP